MANLKLDLLNKLKNEKYYKEMELVRLAQEPNMCYEEKIDIMIGLLDQLNALNGRMGLMEQYFAEPETPQVPQIPPAPDAKPVENKPAGKVHPGQSHAE